MFPMSRRDPRFAFQGLWTRAQAAMKSATLLAPEWRFLARGAAAGLGPAPLGGPICAKPPCNIFFKITICRDENPTSYGVLLYHIYGGGAKGMGGWDERN